MVLLVSPAKDLRQV
ncbi:leucine-rich repeat extensin-like protein 3 [Iris pallida]|nr:leucine-rich repeat extensin-like protein 3 [Iris pallida]